jgi:hypothetical protein
MPICNAIEMARQQARWFSVTWKIDQGGQGMDDTAEQPASVAESAGRPSTGKPSKKWPRLLAVGGAIVLALGAGVGIGEVAHPAVVSQVTYTASQAQAATLKGQVSTLKGQMTGLQSQVTDDNSAVSTAQSQAASAQQTANSNAAAAYKDREAALGDQEKTVQQQEATLKQQLGQVQASSISGDGVYVVGQDIKSGTWHTNGSGNAGANDCYFATLNSSDTENIADNNNFDGPETVNVSGAYALQLNGGCSWVLVP